MMEKPKKERRFLKTLGKIGEILIQEVLLKVGSNLIKRIGGKKTLPSILILLLSISLFAQYPNTGNKQRLGFQTTADGLVWRGSISDTSTIQPVSNQNAWVILDTVNLKIYSFDFTSNVWNQVGTGGGSAFTQPVDSLFFKTSVPPNNVDTAKMRWDSELGTVVLGMYDAVPNELGFKNFWLVKNQTGSTITKGSIVYANGTVGASGRITVAKFIANGTIDAKYLLGITAHDLSNGEDGYVISFGKIRQVNTDTFAAGAILYPSPTVAGIWTDVEPIAPNIDMPIGFCINSSSNNGTIAIRVASGYKLSELHDLAISSPVDRASLYYRGGLWRDTTTALLVSDTSSMLTNYLRSGVASNTYLPLTGGTLTGALNGTSAIFSGNVAIGFPFAYKPLEVFSNFNDFVSVGTNQMSQYQWTGIHFGYRQPNTDYRASAIVFQRNDIPPYIDATGKIHLLNVSYANSGRSADLRDAKLTISNIGGYVGINDTNPTYQLDVNGTLGVTGATTLSSTLGVTGNVGIGVALPSFKLQVNGSSSTPLNFLNNTNNTINILDEKNQEYGVGGGIIFSGKYTDAGITTELAGIRGVKLNNTSGNYSGQLEFYTRNNLDDDWTNDEKMIINNVGNIGIGTSSPNSKLDVRGSVIINEDSGDFDTRIESDGNANMFFVDASTDRVGIGTGSPSKTLDVNGEVKIATVTATPTALLGKDGSNVVGEVTTVAQTGLMTRGSTTATTGTPSAVFSVTHGLGSNPTSVIVTGAGASGAQKLIFEVYAKNSTTFSVQVWNYDGTEAASTSVTIYWLAIK
jgi:hypothetical protein